MTRKMIRNSLPILVGVVAVAALASLSAASARTHKLAEESPSAALIWNTNAVNAVRSSVPTKVQTDGMVYMSYVQAAVYDAVTKLEGRYQPYHDFTVAIAPGASVQAAIAAAARTTLDYYLPDQQAAVDAEYTAYLATLSGNVAGGVAVGEAAANDIIAFRTGDGLKAATPSYGQIGPILPGQWQLQPGQAVQTPWLATMRPFLLEQASQFRAEPPPALTSRQYAKDLNETEAYGAIDSTVRTPEQLAIAYFWVGNNINQYNQTMQNVVAQHNMDLVDATHLLAVGEIVTTDAGIACFDSKFFYQAWRPITAIRNADKDGNPDTTADPTGSPSCRCPATRSIRPSTAASRPPSATPSRPSSARTTSTSRCPEDKTAARSSQPPSTSTPSTTCRSRSSTPASGSASTSATPSSRAKSSATT